MERLAVVCARLGLCSRSEAVRYIRLGLVAVDGSPVPNAAALVSSDASVTLLERGQRMQASKVTIMLHKPLHYASCRAAANVPLARSLLVPTNRAAMCRARTDPRRLSGLAACDILDDGSAGLLLFSQDGRVATRVSRSADVEKEYMVKVLGGVSASQLAVLRATFAEGCHSEANPGVDSDDDEEMLGTASADRSNDEVRVTCQHVPRPDGQDELRIVVQGHLPSRWIHQMCAIAGLRHGGVTRTRVGPLLLGALPSGQWTVVRAWDSLKPTTASFTESPWK